MNEIKIILAIITYITVNNITKAQTIPSYVPLNGMIGWWPLDGNANDVSGNDYNGTLLNGVAPTTDRFSNSNSAYNFDGTDDRIYINNNFFDNGWSEYTISMWIYLNSLTNPNNVNSSHVLFNSSAHNGIAISLNWGSSSKYHLFVGNGTPSTSWNAVTSPASTQNIIDATWKLVTLVKNGNGYSLYINGVLDQSWTSTVTIQSHLYKMYFGSTDPDASSEVINGKLDDIGIWNRALTSSEINALYESQDTINNTASINSSSNSFKIFPNPTNNQITINYGDFNLKNGYLLQISNSLGQIVFSRTIDLQTSLLDITSWGGNGTYFVNVFDTNNKVIETRKIVLQ